MKKNNILKLGLILLFVLFFNLVVFLVTKRNTTQLPSGLLMLCDGVLWIPSVCLFNSRNPKQKIFSVYLILL